MKELYSFVIPCYYSGQTIAYVINEIDETMKERPKLDYEIIAVNDCSPDDVWDVLNRLSHTNKRLKLINLAKNSGKACAVMAGLASASGNIIINLDDDGQCPINTGLWNLVQPLYEGYDACFAKYRVKKESMFKRFGSKVNSIMATYLVSKPKDLTTSNFSAVKRFVVDEMVKYKNPFPYYTGLLVRVTRNIANVEMEERNRVEGEGHFNIKKSFSLFLNGATAFSIKPLRVATFMGIICAIIGFIFGLYTVIRKIVDPNILVGYSSIMAALLFVGGLIMLMLGIIGEYIGRIYICINNAPQYVIREKINFDPKELK